MHTKQTNMNLLLLHKISVWLFLLIYIIKTILLFTNNTSKLASFSKAIKVPEMIISTLFLLTGIYQFYLLGAIKLFQIFKLVAIFAAIPLAIIGYKKANKALAGLAMFLLLMSYGFAEMARKKPYLTSNTTLMVDGQPDGQSVYMNNCAVCHGTDGTKGYNGSADLKKSTLSNDESISIILNGKNNMMPFKGTLSDEEIKAVANYIITLR